MEIIVFILVIVFALLNAKGKKPQAKQAGAPQAVQAKAARAAAQRAQAQAAPKAKAAVPPAEALETLKRRMQTVMQVPPAEGAAMLADDDCHGGSMEHTHAEGSAALEDEDCAGGSMEHTHTEGVSRTEQARRMAAIDRDERGGEALPEVIDARALRRAVVMAEVLGRPRALRARR